MIVRRKWIRKNGTVVERVYNYSAYPHVWRVSKKLPTSKRRGHPAYVRPNANLNGGHSRVLKRLIRLRDGDVCQICGRGKKNKELDTHHKDNLGPHLVLAPNENPSNRITLCHRCHCRLHWNSFDKYEEVMGLRHKGETLTAIGKHYGVSRQRIFQIIQNFSQSP